MTRGPRLDEGALSRHQMVTYRALLSGSLVLAARGEVADTIALVLDVRAGVVGHGLPAAVLAQVLALRSSRTRDDLPVDAEVIDVGTRRGLLVKDDVNALY